MSSRRADRSDRLLDAVASWSIATRLSLLFAACSLSILVGVGVFLYQLLEQDIYRDEVDSFADQFDAIHSILQVDPDLSGPSSLAIRSQYAMPYEIGYGLRVTDGQSHVLFETPGFGDMPSDLLRVPDSSVTAPDLAIARRRRDGRTHLVAAGNLFVGAGDRERRVVYVSYDGSAEAERLSAYRRAIRSIVLWGAAVSVGLGAWVARRGLRPLHEIAQVARRITAERLDERVGQRPWPRELVALAVAFDEMLSRLALDVSRLSQFSADLAHELRTPLTNLIGETEVTLSRSRSESEYRETLESSLEEYRRLARLAEELLFIARLERDSLSAGRWIEMREIADAVKGIFEAMAEEEGIAITCEGFARVEGSPSLFQRALVNLVSNAMTHASAKHVAIQLSRVAGGSEIRVSDDGCGIAEQHMGRIFDRFYRVDSSRARDPGGAGLGLAIVKSIVDLHRGRVEVQSALGLGTSIALTIPDRRDGPGESSAPISAGADPER
jgi:two-component system heavy metal sensor histidine kinase CusS